MQTVRWIGRILSLLSVGFILLFFFGEADFSQPVRLTPQEILMVLFFPVGVTAGNLVGWWREGLGACITLANLIVFYLLDLIFSGTLPSGPFFALLASPSVFYAIYGFDSRHREQNGST